VSRPGRGILAVTLCVLAACSATALAAFSRTATAAQTISSRTLGAPTGLSGAASGHNVNLSWTAGTNGSGYAIAAAANGTSTTCTAASFSALTTTAGTSVTDTGRFTPQGTIECYRVTTTYGAWSSQAGNPTVAVQLGVVAVSADIQDGNRAGRLNPGDTITIVFNQPVSPASGPAASDSVCANTNGTVMIGVTGTGSSCPTTSATTVGTLTGLSINKAGRFDASFAWSGGNTILTVTIDRRSAGQNPKISGTAVYTPTTTAAGLLSQTGSFHTCSSNSGGGDCTPTAAGGF
jgi:endoglucanase